MIEEGPRASVCMDGRPERRHTLPVLKMAWRAALGIMMATTTREPDKACCMSVLYPANRFQYSAVVVAE